MGYKLKPNNLNNNINSNTSNNKFSHLINPKKPKNDFRDFTFYDKDKFKFNKKPTLKPSYIKSRKNVFLGVNSQINKQQQMTNNAVYKKEEEPKTKIETKERVSSPRNTKFQSKNEGNNSSKKENIYEVPNEVIIIPIKEPINLVDYQELQNHFSKYAKYVGFFLITKEEREILNQKYKDNELLLENSTLLSNKGISYKRIKHLSNYLTDIKDINKIHNVGVLFNTQKQMPFRTIKITEVIEPVIDNKDLIDDSLDSTIPKNTAEQIPLNSTESKVSGLDNVDKKTFLKAKFEVVLDDRPNKDENLALRIHALYHQIAKFINLIVDRFKDTQASITYESLSITKPTSYGLGEIVLAMCNPSPEVYQELIESKTLESRLCHTLTMISNLIQIFEFSSSVDSFSEKQLFRNQKKMFLVDQLKAIRRELGLDVDEKQALKNKFNQRWAALNITDPHIQQVFKEEIDRLSTIEVLSSEYGVSRNYIDWMTLLPWNQYSNDNFNLEIVKESLDKDHYGLEDIKEMIQSFIAVGKLRGSVGGKIILLVGPPGTGKTSIGKSIADALGRQFYRFSVGGMSDVAEIKGHRRTFTGAMPGKIIQALKMTKTSNPVIMIDEIDKISKSANQSDPYAALLEILDPQQNKTFLDHYLDLPFDLSKVLFICTANLTHTIPAPLLDRMDIMKLNGYIQSEQIQITERYLIPSVRSETGLNESHIEITRDTIQTLCEYYCREPGVRNLKKTIEKIFRKLAFNIASNEENIINTNNIEQEVKEAEILVENKSPIKPDFKKIIITPENLETYAGKQKYRRHIYYKNPQVGVTLGLGWSEHGGMPLYVESVIDKYQPSPDLKTTGSLGEVMKESIDIAYTYAKKFLPTIDPDNQFFNENAIHLHTPEGSTPKDGPSAGITLTSSLLSLATGKVIKPNLAMTGEVTLTGKVIAVGGISEKMIAAKREGVKEVIVPRDNKKDVLNIPEFVMDGILVYFVEYYKDVYSIAFNENPTIEPIKITPKIK